MIDKSSVVLLQGALGVEFFEQLKKFNPRETFVMEGRPSLEAARVNCRELLKHKITPTLISDNMAGFLFFKNLVKEAWAAYQVSDTDGAVCDIGALIVGILGKRHNIPVYLFPSNRNVGAGSKPALQFLGKEKDLIKFQNKKIAPKGIRAYVPLVEWLPNKYITKIL